MIINFNKIFSIYLILILFSCSKSELSDNLAKDVHDQLSTNVEITLTKKGNITAKIKSEILKKNNQSLQLELYNNVNVNLFDESFQQKSLIKSESAMVNEKENKISKKNFRGKKYLQKINPKEYSSYRNTRSPKICCKYL